MQHTQRGKSRLQKNTRPRTQMPRLHSDVAAQTPIALHRKSTPGPEVRRVFLAPVGVACHPVSIRFIERLTLLGLQWRMRRPPYISISVLTISFCKYPSLHVAGCCAGWKHQRREGAGKVFFVLFRIFSLLRQEQQLRDDAPWQMNAIILSTNRELERSEFGRSKVRPYRLPKKSPNIHPSIRFDLTESLCAR